MRAHRCHVGHPIPRCGLSRVRGLSRLSVQEPSSATRARRTPPGDRRRDHPHQTLNRSLLRRLRGRPPVPRALRATPRRPHHPTRRPPHPTSRAGRQRRRGGSHFHNSRSGSGRRSTGGRPCARRARANQGAPTHPHRRAARQQQDRDPADLPHRHARGLRNV
jgi:hypothetical protein